jgi:GT2 family glycosyltransferase/glycosyltransferase involved in cell wall biosynthesis/FMN phosphatase YigB (HAD superfamily)
LEYIVDNNLKGKYEKDYTVITFDQFFVLGIKNLIIVDTVQNTGSLYECIRKECYYNGVSVYDYHGKLQEEEYKNIVKLDVGYRRIKQSDILCAINRCDVVSVDIGDTLLSHRYVYYSDFFGKIVKRINEIGVNIFDFMQRVEDIKKRDTYSNLRVIIEVIVSDLCLPIEYVDEIWLVVMEEAKKSFVPRKAVVEILKYAKEQGKKVCLVEDLPDYRLPDVIWKYILQEYGIDSYDDIVCSGTYWLHKEEGLYREVIKKYGKNLNYLHIGDKLDEDVIIPRYCGMDTFWIKGPRDLFNSIDSIQLEQLEKPNVRDLFERYVLKVYGDYYIISDVKSRVSQDESLEMAAKLQETIDFCKSCSAMTANEAITYEPVLYDEIENRKSLADYEKLEFMVYDKPKVSIIIPVYNQFGYTYNCLRAILEHSEDVKYEIIVADDCSQDNVKELEKVASGITVIHNKENLRFLRNCNNAAQAAKGEYLLFLNNDTQVQPKWLEPLVQLLDQNDDIGMVGAKLVYPDGRLQEAGGILWRDGSAWNYGHLMNPDAPEYCYVKDADYISGAAIMIRTSLWKQIGGFDDAFAPAYYEDTDLAFEVRKHRYRVCFQPKSVVVHFEGISNGTDISTGLKNYQVANQKKFFEKWKNVLEKEHFHNGEEVYLAKDRGQLKKQILVVDHYVPNYDKDAGGRCTFMYLKAFLNMGMKVTFIGDNFAKPEPYTTALTQMGIEVLYGDFYYVNWQGWLKENLKYFDYVYLQRPHISIKYIDLVKEYSRAKVFYFAHDLHHVRMYREYLLSGDQEVLKESEHWKKIEMELFEKADVGHVVGSYEQEIMQKAFPDKPIRNIPLYIYDEALERIEKDFSKREDILFVGGFAHAPNIDAVVWFAEHVFPHILEKHPDLVWHIVGSKAPQEVKALASDHIVLEGFVSDEDLGELYRKCRLVVVPLRYGAGVKGKIVEAAYYQIPVVTTAIGGEGLDASVGSFVMEDDPDRMAELIEGLYTDFDRLREMSDAGERLIQKYFTSKAAQDVLLADMNLV